MFLLMKRSQAHLKLGLTPSPKKPTQIGTEKIKWSCLNFSVLIASYRNFSTTDGDFTGCVENIFGSNWENSRPADFSFSGITLASEEIIKQSIPERVGYYCPTKIGCCISI